LYLRKEKLFEMTMHRREAINGFVFIAPWLLGFLFFYFFNIFQAIQFSFSTITVIPTGGFTVTYVGWNNYFQAFRVDPTFYKNLYTTLTAIFPQTLGIIFFSLFISILLNRKFKGRFIFRAIFFLPILLTTPLVISTITTAMANLLGGVQSVPSEIVTDAVNTSGGTGFNIGLLYDTLLSMHFPAQLLSYIEVMVTSLFTIVRQSGVQILIFIAALQSIPSSLYEVAEIEGSTAYETFWKITFPLVSPLILTNVIYTMVDLYSSSQNVVARAKDEFFSKMNFGFSSAMTISSSFLMCVILIVVGFLISRKVFYYV